MHDRIDQVSQNLPVGANTRTPSDRVETPPPACPRSRSVRSAARVESSTRLPTPAVRLSTPPLLVEHEDDAEEEKEEEEAIVFICCTNVTARSSMTLCIWAYCTRMSHHLYTRTRQFGPSVHSLVHSFFGPYFHSFDHSSFVHSFNRSSFDHSFVHSFVHSTCC